MSLPLPADDWPLISTYSRAEALEDGALMDVTPTAYESGFRYPVAVTQALQAMLEPSAAEQALGQSYKGRLWDTLWMAWLSARRTKGDRFSFQVILAVTSADAPDGLSLPEVTLVAVCGPGDHGEPVITIGLPEDF